MLWSTAVRMLLSWSLLGGTVLVYQPLRQSSHQGISSANLAELVSFFGRNDVKLNANLLMPLFIDTVEGCV